MNKYEVITDFTVDNLDIIRKTIGNNYIWLTNNWQIVDQLEDHVNIETIDDYIRRIDLSSFYKIFSDANENMKFFQEGLKEVKFEEVSIVEGMKNLVYSYFVFLEQIKFLFKTRKDYVFLFTNTENYYFAINDIAKKLEYSTEYGISAIIDGRIIEVFFDETKNSDKRFLYYETRYLYEECYEPTKSEKEECGKVFEILKQEELLQQRNSRVAFFLNNNNADLYLKPIYPVLEQFLENKSEYSIFTFDDFTTEMLEEKKYGVTNLIHVINQLVPKVLVSKSDLILEFIETAKKLSMNDVFDSYIKIIRSDPVARFLALVISKIYVLNLLLKNSQVRSILVALDPSPDMDLVCAVAKKYYIKTYTIPATPAIPPIAFMSEMYNAEKILVDGIRTKETIQRYIDKNRIIIVGNPRYDYINTKKKSEKKEKHVFIAMSRWHENDEIWMSEIIQFCNNNNIKISIKPHPVYNKAFRGIHTQKINKIKEICKDQDYEILETNDSSIIAKASLIITERSTIGIEAVMNDIPLLLIRTDKRNEDTFGYNFVKEKVAKQISSIDELKREIKRIILGEKWKKIILGEKFRNQNTINRFKRKINYLNDGNAAKRVYEIMTKRN